MEEINLTWMYPDILNLHGDRGNIMALDKMAKILNVKININKIKEYNQKIDFKNSDIIFFNPGELKSVGAIISALNSQTEELKEYIEQNKIIVLIGTSGAIMSKQIIKKDGTKIEGLGYLDMVCKERETIFGDDMYFTLNKNPNEEIAGCQIQVIDTYLNSDIALGTIKYGRGNLGTEEKTEGAKYNNVIFTNALGPVLVKNIWYAEKLIKLAMKNKGIDINKIINSEEYEYELNSLEAIKRFVSTKQNIIK